MYVCGETILFWGILDPPLVTSTLSNMASFPLSPSRSPFYIDGEMTRKFLEGGGRTQTVL